MLFAHLFLINLRTIFILFWYWLFLLWTRRGWRGWRRIWYKWLFDWWPWANDKRFLLLDVLLMRLCEILTVVKIFNNYFKIRSFIILLVEVLLILTLIAVNADKKIIKFLFDLRNLFLWYKIILAWDQPCIIILYIKFFETWLNLTVLIETRNGDRKIVELGEFSFGLIIRGG